MIAVKKYLLLLVASFLFIDIVAAENTNTEDLPVYRNGVLTIPRIDTPEQAGIYKNVEFVFDQELDAWQLNSVVAEQFKAPVDEVVLLAVTDSFPAQVFLQVSGEFSGCGMVGEIDQRVQDNKFEIQIYAIYPNDPDTSDPVACGAATNPYLRVIPLTVYGLAAGDYEYRVNDNIIGSFNLPFDNKFNECEGFDCDLVTSGFLTE